MVTKEDVIKTALRAYPCSDLLPVDFENMCLEELLDAARKNEFADGLASFIVIELFEGLDEDADGNIDLEQSTTLMERAAEDINAVLQALFEMNLQDDTPLTCDAASQLK